MGRGTFQCMDQGFNRLFKTVIGAKIDITDHIRQSFIDRDKIYPFCRCH